MCYGACGERYSIIAAKAVALGEALTDDFKVYAKNVVENASALAAGLTSRGIKLVSGGTDNHLMTLDLRGTGITGKELEHRLDEVHITANKNTIPSDPESPFVTSGLRIGTPAVTTRGFGKAEMEKVASFIADVIGDFDGCRERVSEEAQALCARFPIY